MIHRLDSPSGFCFANIIPDPTGVSVWVITRIRGRILHRYRLDTTDIDKASDQVSEFLANF